MTVEQRRIQCWDIDAGYAAAQEKYRAGYSGLVSAGFEEADVYLSGEVARLARDLDDTIYLAAAEIFDIENLFYIAFLSLSGFLHQYYQSEFAPAFCSMLKMGPLENLSPVEDIDVSFKWHVDNGPSSHLKLIIYLNDDHDGATAVMSRQDSRKFIDAGYLEGERLFQLDDFAKEHEISYQAMKIQPKAGSGVIFEPTNVLHKGVYPTFGERRVFQMGIIPWGKPWEDFYEEHWAKGYTNSNGFPRYEDGLD